MAANRFAMQIFILFFAGIASVAFVFSIGLRPSASAVQNDARAEQSAPSVQAAPPPAVDGAIPPPPLGGELTPGENQNGLSIQTKSVMGVQVPAELPNSTHIADEIDDGLGERDPFRKPKYIVDRENQRKKKVQEKEFIDERIEAIRRWNILDYRLIGIIWDVDSPKAMILDPNNTMHLIKKKNRIGNKNGIVMNITEGELIVTEMGIPRVLQIKK